MPQRQVVDKNPDKAFGDLSKKWIFIAIMISAPGFLIFAWFGYPDKGLVAYFSIAIITLLLKVSWQMRYAAWLWLIMAAFVFLHAYLITNIGTINLKTPAVILVPFGIADFSVWFSILWTAHNYFVKRQK